MVIVLSASQQLAAAGPGGEGGGVGGGSDSVEDGPADFLTSQSAEMRHELASAPTHASHASPRAWTVALIQ